MAYNNKVREVAAAVSAVLFLAVAIVPQWIEAQPMPEMDPICAVSIPEIVKHCYSKISVLPTEECCKDLKTASKREVTCLCDNFIANPHPLFANITKVYFNQVNANCSVVEKYACNGVNGATNKIAASMVLFGLVASMFF